MHIRALILAPLETPRRVLAKGAGRWPLRLLLMAAALSAPWAQRHAGAEPSSPPPSTFPGGLLEGPPASFVPKQPLSEAQRDRQEAAALAAAGRAHQQRDEYRQALRMFQRAVRADPQCDHLAPWIVWLAYHLNQDDVAVRYVKLADPADDNAKILGDLGFYLLRRGDVAGAAALLERALAAQERAGDTTGVILLHMELGRLYHLLEQDPKAAPHFARVVQAIDHPRRSGLDEEARQTMLTCAGETYGVIGDCFLRARRLSEATAAFQKGNALAPDAGLLEFNLARVAAGAGKPEEALARLEKALSLPLPGEGTAPYELLAEVLKKLGREKELTQRLKQLAAADPANAALGCCLAEQYARAGQLDKAESLYVAALKQTPTLAGYAGLMNLCRKGKRADTLLTVLGDVVEKEGALDGLGTEEKAIVADAAVSGRLVEAARRRLASSPEKLDFGMRKAVAILAIEGKRVAVAAEFFDLAIAARPKEAADLLLLWGLGLLMDDRPAEAAKVFRRGLDLKPPADDEASFWFYLAGALALSDRADEALAAARKAASMRRNSSLFCSRVPWILERAKRDDEAIEAYAALVTRFDGAPTAKMQVILRDAGSASDRPDSKVLAADLLAVAAVDDDRAPQTREVLRDARLALSGLCVLKRRLPEAEEWLQQVLDEFPDDVGASNDLGYLWADQGVHLQRALKMIRLAVAAEPDNSAYRDSLGWVDYRLGRYGEAVAELEKAAAQERAAEVFDHLGDARLKAGQRQQADSAWRRAAAAFRKDKEEEKAREVEKKMGVRP